MDSQAVQKNEKQVNANQSESQEQVQQMTPQLAGQLVELLRDPKVQVKYGSLNAILQHTKSDAAKLLFVNTDLFKLIIQSMKIEQIHKLCLSTLIHFSSNDECAEKLTQFIQPIVLDLRQAKGLPEQLGLLLLLNISKQFQFTSKLLPKPETKEQGQSKQTINQKSSLLLQMIFSFFNSKPSKRWVIANIFVNLSSHEEGRLYIAREKLYLQFLKHINDEKQSLRLAVLRIIRNIAFLWQKQDIITELLKAQNKVIDQICIHILIMLIKSNLLQNTQKPISILKQSKYNQILDYDMQIEPQFDRISTTKQKSINQIQLCVDIIIILSNSDFPTRKPVFCMGELKQIIGLLNFTGISEESKDKLQALETFCFW